MKTLPRLIRIGLWAALAAPVFARAGDPPIIAKARAYLGSESALDSVKSVRLTGMMTVETSGTPATKRTANFDIIFQRPCEESLTTVSPDLLVQTGLDDWDGWQRSQKRSPGDPAVFDDRRSPALTILAPEEIQSLRADVWENLSYYRDIQASGGLIEDLGPATMDGIACEKVAFEHSGGVTYYRYFDAATGRLVFTESLRGARIREQGEQFADAIRFPKTIVVQEKNAAGKDQTTTMTIDRVTLNQAYPESMFATPLPPLAPEEVKPGELDASSSAPNAQVGAAANATASGVPAAPKQP